MSDVTLMLTELGFGEYEARAYLALLERNPLNGYELARTSGVPRGNIYAILEKLEERGAAMRLESSEGTRYAPVPPSELINRMADRYRQTLDRAGQALQEIDSPPAPEYVWNARGYPALLEHARTLIENAQRRLLFAIWPAEATALADSVAAADGRGVEIVTLCLPACPSDCGACRGQIHRQRVVPEHSNRWLVIVADDGELLAGEINPRYATGSTPEGALAIRTRQKLLVELTAAYIRHSIALGAVLSDLGPGLANALAPETRSALTFLTPFGGDEGWLEQMSRLLANSN